MLRKIAIFTNKEAERQRTDFKVTHIDILVFIAVLLCRGFFCQKMDLKSMWSEKYGLSIIRALCSRNTFTTIMRFIRFDNKSERSRTSSDKFTMVREIGKDS